MCRYPLAFLCTAHARLGPGGLMPWAKTERQLELCMALALAARTYEMAGQARVLFDLNDAGDRRRLAAVALLRPVPSSAVRTIPLLA